MSAEKMTKLFDLLTDDLIAKIERGECDAATLNVARQWLKDHKVLADAANKNSKINKLGSVVTNLPFKPTDDERQYQ